jgi:ABC-type Mn2+/Zn2+ transport system ATPase subunit
MLVEITGATFGYDQRRPVVRVNSLSLHAGRCLGVFGPNGAGKTTVVRGLTGLLPPVSGTVNRAENSAIRFGYLPQHRALELHWPMTGFDAAAMALSALRRFGRIRRRDAAKVREAMERMDVRQLARHSFAKLSGGQQQRLLLAGALATEPTVLVLDEPTDGLDVRSRQSLLELLHAENRRGLCTVMISHDVEDLLHLADEIAWLHPGDDAGEPSHVELIGPQQFRDRVLHASHAAGVSGPAQTVIPSEARDLGVTARVHSEVPRCARDDTP